jgi:hypothetical protein
MGVPALEYRRPKKILSPMEYHKCIFILRSKGQRTGRTTPRAVRQADDVEDGWQQEVAGGVRTWSSPGSSGASDSMQEDTHLGSG